eukprot:TRINITY_DN31512_c0_g1_i1.p1 TRINITY_DN31512_c0_g1~~TRINITY_DN31512_c0_g1_i1.p1  ORF type:complete len:486 (-),score=80.47 TRINITY_DN31512_c0_g1_i1:12-1469(-)
MLSRRTQTPRHTQTQRSLRIIGDSNAVGYREGPTGTKGYLAKRLAASFRVEPSIGRTGLTVTPSSLTFLPWAQEHFRDKVRTDYAVIILGTNDITLYQKREMQWSQACSPESFKAIVRKHFRATLTWVHDFAGRVLVVEPINAMASRQDVRCVLCKALQEEAQSCGATFLQMDWAAADLQQASGSSDPHHFNRPGADRLVEQILKGIHAPAPPCRMAEGSPNRYTHVRLLKMGAQGADLPPQAVVILQTLAKCGGISSIDSVVSKLEANGLKSVQGPAQVFWRYVTSEAADRGLLVKQQFVKLLRKEALQEPPQKYIQLVKMAPSEQLPEQVQLLLKTLRKAGGTCGIATLAAKLAASGLVTVQTPRKVISRLIARGGLLRKKRLVKVLGKPPVRKRLPTYVVCLKPQLVLTQDDLPPQAVVILKALCSAGGICEVQRLIGSLRHHGLQTVQRPSRIFRRFVTTADRGLLRKCGYVKLVKGRVSV